MNLLKKFNIHQLWNSNSIKNNILFGIILASIVSPFLSHVYIFLVPLFFIFLFLSSEPRIILFFVITSFLVLSREISDKLRLFVQIANLLLLFILFLRANKDNIFSFKEISREIKVLLLLYFFTMFFASFINSNLRTALPIIFQQFIFLLMIYIIYSLIDSDKIIKYILFAIIVSALLNIFSTSFLVFKTGFSFFFLEQEFFNSLNSSTLIHKNTIAILIFYSIFFLFVFYDINKNSKNRYLIFLCFFVLLIGTIITNSRGLLLSLVIALLHLTYQVKPKIFLIIIVTILAFLIIAFIPPFNEYTLFLLRLESVSSNRDIITNSVLKVIENNFWFGSGVAGTKAELYKNIPFLFGTPEEFWIRKHYYQIEYGHAHNFYLFFLSDLGLLGLIVSLLIVYYYFKIGNRVRRISQKFSRFHEQLSTVLVSLGLGMFVRGILEWGGILSYGMISLDLPFWLGFSILIYLDIKYAKLDANYTDSPNEHFDKS